MVNYSRSVSDAELDVLKALWEIDGGTVKEVWEALQEAGRSWALTTVQTLLKRLQTKGYLTHSKDGRSHVFNATVSLDQLLEQELESLAERVCEGAATPLLLSLFRGRRFTREEIARFRHLLDELESQPPRSRKKSRKRRSRS